MQFFRLRRREFLGVLGSATAAWSLAADAQQQSTRVVGFLSSRAPTESAGVIAAFRKGLREMGFVEGQNLVIAFRWAEGRYDHLPALASDLVDLHVEVLLAAGGSPSAVAAKAATSTIPVVFLAGDPVHLGLVASLNKPGGNVTGISNLSAELATKSVELLQEMVPAAKVIAYLVNPSNPIAETVSMQAQAAGSALGIQIHILNARTLSELDQAFETMAKLGIGALGVMPDPFLDSQRERLLELCARHKAAGCYAWREYVAAGGLMSYGTNLADSYRQAGIYAGRILKGERPADLPVMQPIKYELVLNLQTAKTLGLQVPPKLLALADEVIE
jgi:putative ABC transport system substrate-binding protein